MASKRPNLATLQAASQPRSGLKRAVLKRPIRPVLTRPPNEWAGVSRTRPRAPAPVCPSWQEKFSNIDALPFLAPPPPFFCLYARGKTVISMDEWHAFATRQDRTAILGGISPIFGSFSADDTPSAVFPPTCLRIPPIFRLCSAHFRRVLIIIAWVKIRRENKSQIKDNNIKVARTRHAKKGPNLLCAIFAREGMTPTHFNAFHAPTYFELANTLTYRAGHFRYFLIFSLIKNDCQVQKIVT